MPRNQRTTVLSEGQAQREEEAKPHGRRAKRLHELITKFEHKGLKYAKEAGDELIKAKALVGEHGRWERWLAENFQASEDTAQNYMLIARNGSRFPEAKSIRQFLEAIRGEKRLSKQTKDLSATEDTVTERAITDDEFASNDDLVKLATDYLVKSIPSKRIVDALSRQSKIFLYRHRNGEAGNKWKTLLQKHLTNFVKELNAELDDEFIKKVNSTEPATRQAGRPTKTVERRRITRRDVTIDNRTLLQAEVSLVADEVAQAN